MVLLVPGWYPKKQAMELDSLPRWRRWLIREASLQLEAWSARMVERMVEAWT